MIRVHRLLFVIAVAAGLVSKFSHVHGLSVFLHLSTSSNPDFEKNMDLTAFVTLIDECVTQGTKFKLCPLVFQRINDLGILSGPKTKRGTRAGRLHRLWHCCPPAWYTMPSLQRATTRPPLYHPFPVVNQATTRPPLYHNSPVVNQATTRPPLYHPSPVVNQATTPPPLSPLPYGQPGDHPSTIVSILPCGQPGDHPSITVSPLPCGQPGDHPSTTVSPLPCGQPGDYPSTIVSTLSSGQPGDHSSTSPLPRGQPGDHPSNIVSTLPSHQIGDHPSTSTLPCGQPGDHPSNIVSNLLCGQPGDHPSTTVSPFPCGQPGDHPSTTVSPLPCGQPGDHPSTTVLPLPYGQPGDHPSTNVSTLPSGQPGDHPSTTVSPFPCGQPGDHPITFVSSVPSGQPGDHPSTTVSPLPCGQPGDHPSFTVSSLPCGQPGDHPSTAPLSCGQPGDHPSTSPLPCGQPGDHPSISVSTFPNSQPGDLPSTSVSPLPCGQPGDHPSTSVSPLPCGQPGDHPSISPLPCGQPGYHPSTSVSPLPCGQPGDHPSTSPLPCGQPGYHPSTSVSPLPCGQPGDHPSISPLPCGQPGYHPSTSVSPLPCGQPGDHPSTSQLPCGQPGDHPSTSVSPLHCGQPGDHPSTSPLPCGQPGDHPSTSPLPCGQPGDHPSTAVSPLPSDQPDDHLVNHLGDVSAGCSPCLPFTVGSPPVVSSPSSPPLSPTCSSAPRPRKATHVIVGVWNARSAVNKALEVNDMIVERDLDVLCLTETWLREEGDDVSIGEMTPPGFSFLHRPRVSGRGGGVALIFRQHLNVRLCKHRSFSSFENIEVCITRGKQTIRLGCVYRPPPSAGNKLTTCDFIDEFGMFLSDDSIPAENVLVVGDFNFHMDKPNDPDTRRFVQLYNPLGFDQFVTEPTHVKGHILDIVLCRARTLVTSVNVDNLYMSDHFLLTIGTDLSRPRVPRKVVKCRNVKGIDRSLFRADIAQSPLVIGSPDGVDDLLDLYNATLLGLLNKHAPEKEKVVPDRPSSPWINEAVIKAKQARRCAERKKRKTGLVVHIEIYKQARNNVTKLIKQAKASHFHAKLEDAETDSKKMFSLLSTLLNRENRSDSLPDMIPQEAAKSFSRFFQEKIETIRQEFNNDPLGTTENFASSVHSSDLLSSFDALSEDQILKLIRESKSTTATVDPAPTKLVLEFTDVLLPVFQKIVNLSLTSGTVPIAFKKAVVKPLIKKPNLDPEVLGNYRPVSNLPYLSKILERAVADQLQAHLDTNGLHVKFQSAYRRGHSTETALLRILNDLLVMVDGGNNAVLVLLDLSAAFDTLDHTLLLQRLHAEIGLDGSALDWFSSYLSCRSQQVLVGHALSAETPLLCGVPQGSVLGPLLFSLYTRQLADLIDKFCIDYHFFADDSELYSCVPTEPESALSALRNVESCCRQIKIWTTKNKLKLNEQKTEVLLCGPSSRRETVPVDCLSVGEASIPFSNVVKTLGVTLDAELSMEQHVSAVVRSCFFHIRSLSKVRPYITYKAASSIAVCLILSKLDYCNSLLSGLPQKQIKRLQAVQNAAARTVMKCKKTDHITPILRQLHWLPIQKRIRHKILSATYRSVHDNTPLYLSDLLQKHNPSRLLRSASRSLLDVPGPRDSKTKRYGQRAFRYVAPSLWNVLPENIKEKDSIQSFRPSLKTHFFTQG